jgi:hypothetical protein
VLALLREHRQRNGKTPLSVIRPVPTRWTAYYLAYSRLLTLQKTIQLVAKEDDDKDDKDRQMRTGTGASKRKADSMMDIIENPLFWRNLTR